MKPILSEEFYLTYSSYGYQRTNRPAFNTWWSNPCTGAEDEDKNKCHIIIASVVAVILVVMLLIVALKYHNFMKKPYTRQLNTKATKYPM